MIRLGAMLVLSSLILSAPAWSDDRAGAARTIVLNTLKTYATDHNTAKAQAGYLQALDVDATYAPAWFGLGVMFEADGDRTNAIDAFRHVITRAPGSSLAAAATEEIRRSEAAAKLETTPEGRRKRQYDGLVFQARQFLAAKQPAAAAEQAKAAQAIDPERWEAYALAGQAAQMQGQSPQAVRFYRSATSHADATAKSKLLAAITQMTPKGKAAAENEKAGDNWRALNDYNYRLIKHRVAEQQIDAEKATLDQAQRQINTEKQQYLSKIANCTTADCAQDSTKEALNRRQTELNQRIDGYNTKLNAWEEEADALEAMRKQVEAKALTK